FLCLVASSSLFPPCLKSSSDFHVLQSSSDNDPCLYNRLCVCLLLAGTFASTTSYLDNDPGLFTRLRDCLLLIGFVCLYLDCHTGYRTRSVKVVILHLCLRVEHLDRKLPRTLHRVKIDLPSPFSGED